MKSVLQEGERWYHLIKGYVKHKTLPRSAIERQAAKLAVCSLCQNRRVFFEHEIPAMLALAIKAPRSVWCGMPGEPSAEHRTCGCMVGAETIASDKPPATTVILTYKGEQITVQPAYKTEVDDPCPMGLF